MWVSSGNAELDDILGRGLRANRMYLLSGDPGAGKTTLGLQFLLEGHRRGERGLYVALSETREELREVAASHGWSLDAEDIEIFELVPSEAALDPDQQATLFHPAEVELSETTRAILDVVDRVKPARVVFDSLSELRLLAQDPLRYRRQILALKQYFIGRGATVLLLDDRSGGEHDTHLESIAHGVIVLETLNPTYGAERRRLRVQKMRGQAFRGGYHDYRILPGGLRVFPRLVAADHRERVTRDLFSTGVAGLDALLGGGLLGGTSTLVMGPAGCGKSSLTMQFAYAAAQRGDASAFFLFDENPETLRGRSAALGMPLDAHLASGRIRLTQVDPAELSPGEFFDLIRKAVAGADDRPPARIVVIDSLNGYLQAMPEERFLVSQLHELLAYLGQTGVLTFLVLAQAGIVGNPVSPIDTSYLSDAILLLRYFEARGSVHQAISVLKKRTGGHERTIRELVLGPGGVTVGEPLVDFEGVLTGAARSSVASPPVQG